MGILRKNPGDKLEINPIKFWGGVSMLALFASFVFYYFGAKSSLAVVTPGEGGTSVTIEGKPYVAPPSLTIKDPNCEEIFQGEIDEETHMLDFSNAPESGLVALCGRVQATITDNNETKSGNVRSRDVREGIRGATVAIYENGGGGDVDLEDVVHGGGNGSGKGIAGELVSLFSSTVTDQYGYYRIKMRALGPNSNRVYVVVLCNGVYSGGKAVSSLKHNSILNLPANCDPDVIYDYITPPYALKITLRDKVQECTTTGSQMTEEYQGGIAQGKPLYLPIKYNQASRVTVGGWIQEDNYDFRYVSTPVAAENLFAGGGVSWGNFFENTGGAQWYGDCVNEFIKKEDGNGDSAEWACSSKTINEKYGAGGGGYLVNNSLPFIPEKSELLAYRRLDGRNSVKQINQNPFSVQQFTTKTFGNLVTYSQFIEVPENMGDLELIGQDDPLVPCYYMEHSNFNHSMFDPSAKSYVNAGVTQGWGVGLMSPYTPDMIKDKGLLGEDLDRAFCKLSDSKTLSLREVMEDYELRRRYFHTAAVVPKGSGGMPWNFQASDSVFQDDIARDGELLPFFTEAEQAFRDRMQSIFPPNQNWTANTVGNLFTSGVLLDEGVLYRKGNLLSGLYSPYGDTAADVFKVPEEEEEGELGGRPAVPSPSDEPRDTSEWELPTVDTDSVPGDQVWDLGTFITGQCAVSKIYNVNNGAFQDNPIDRNIEEVRKVLPTMHNFFEGNPMHLLDQNVSTGTYYSNDSVNRDRIMSDDGTMREIAKLGSPLWGDAPTANRDIFDSMLEMTAGGVTPGGGVGVNLQKITSTEVQGLQIAAFLNGLAETLTNLLNLIDNLLGTSLASDFGLLGETPTKSLGDRDDFEATFYFNEKVEYPLNAQNFNGYFPSYSDGCLGCLGHEDYPWDENQAPLKGKTCDVYPGVGTPPDEDNYGLNLGGMRTCKIAACRVLTKEYKWVGPPDTGRWKEETDTRGCTKEEEYQALTEQLDSWPGSFDEIDCDGPSGFEENHDPNFEVGDCEPLIAVNLVRAGPYKRVIPFKLLIGGQAQQDFVAEDNDGHSAVEIDTAMNASHRTAKMLSSPGTSYNERNLAFLDWDFTKSNQVKKQFGYDTPGMYTSFDQVSDTVASPTKIAMPPQYDNDIFYHCNVEFVDMQQNPRNTPSEVLRNIVIPGPEYDWDCEVMPFIMGECDPEAFNQIPGGMPYPIPDAEGYFQLYILSKMTPTVLDAYGFASAMTGIPCEIMAGIHFMEGSNNPWQSVHDGHAINVSDLPFDAMTAAQHLVGKLALEGINKEVKDWELRDYVLAITHYNGDGNANCSDPKTPWCTDGTNVEFYGWDDPYPMNWIDNVHTGMYIKFCFDLTLCTELTPEQITGGEDGSGTNPFGIDPDTGWLKAERPGVLAVAAILNKILNQQ